MRNGDVNKTGFSSEAWVALSTSVMKLQQTSCLFDNSALKQALEGNEGELWLGGVRIPDIAGSRSRDAIEDRQSSA
jgi:hypothetical protein